MCLLCHWATGQATSGAKLSFDDRVLTADPPIINAVAAGNTTITAGSASADVTVIAASTLPTGTVLWSNPGDGSGVSGILPAVPSSTGVADVFAFQGDGSVQAITSTGTTAWTAPNVFGSGIPDFQGGLVVNNSQSVYKLDGLTGQPYPTRTQPGYGSFRAWGISSVCLTATKRRPYWASTKKLCNEWRAAEKSPVSKSVISGGSGPRL